MVSVAQRSPARTRLLDAAESMLFDRGIRATSVDELLRRAEVSAATLYAQFGSKDALVAEVLRLRLADWQAVWDQHIIAADDDTSRLLALFDALADYRDTRGAPGRWCAFLATATELPDATDDIRRILSADTELLTTRLLHFSSPLAGARAQDLADEVLMAYNGTLVAFLRGRPAAPIETGRRLAAAAVRVHSQG